MSDHRTALLPFSTLATYVPEGDHDTALMAELGGKETRSHDLPRRSGLLWLLTCGSGPESGQPFRSEHSRRTERHQLILRQRSRHQDWTQADTSCLRRGSRCRSAKVDSPEGHPGPVCSTFKALSTGDTAEVRRLSASCCRATSELT